MKQGLSVTVRLNYATALLLARNVSGCVALLKEVNQEQVAYVGKLRAAIERWRRSLGWWRRLAFDWYGAEPSKPVTLDFQPGELTVSHELRPAA